MKATDLIGYSYEAALHCVDCTVARHKATPFANDDPADVDDNDIPYSAMDGEGNFLAPIFESTELELGDCCDDCFKQFREEVL